MVDLIILHSALRSSGGIVENTLHDVGVKVQYIHLRGFSRIREFVYRPLQRVCADPDDRHRPCLAGAVEPFVDLLHLVVRVDRCVEHQHIRFGQVETVGHDRWVAQQNVRVLLSLERFEYLCPLGGVDIPVDHRAGVPGLLDLRLQ